MFHSALVHTVTVVVDHSSHHNSVCCDCLHRIEANQMEDRAMNKMWLVRHLEVTRQLVLEDLRVVKVEHHLPLSVIYTLCDLCLDGCHGTKQTCWCAVVLAEQSRHLAIPLFQGMGHQCSSFQGMLHPCHSCPGTG